MLLAVSFALTVGLCNFNSKNVNGVSSRFESSFKLDENPAHSLRELTQTSRIITLDLGVELETVGGGKRYLKLRLDLNS